ncbi:MAG: hypothetical protein ACI8SJ_000474 [Shewanella sp.]|jgi:uncharacterized protein YggL (DUF469 family)
MKMNKSKRSKRLSKKLYVDEYAVFGFEVSCKLQLETEAVFDVFFDELIALVESRGLILGGGGYHTFSVMISSDGRYDSPKDNDIDAVTNWLSTNPICSDVLVGSLIDLNSRI